MCPTDTRTRTHMPTHTATSGLLAPPVHYHSCGTVVGNVDLLVAAIFRPLVIWWAKDE